MPDTPCFRDLHPGSAHRRLVLSFMLSLKFLVSRNKTPSVFICMGPHKFCSCPGYTPAWKLRNEPTRLWVPPACH